ncbi:MAG: hypothetical protein FWE72_00740 [Spirochaetaceae bacterium]|nr:hypothetical protein [Spirochaetaceae bacterium]
MEKKVFTFEDIIHLDDRAIWRILRETNIEYLRDALIGAEETILEKIYKNISPRIIERLKKMVKEAEQDYISQDTINERRGGIVYHTIVGLATKGEIVLPDNLKLPTRGYKAHAQDSSRILTKDNVVHRIEKAIQTGHLDLYNWDCKEKPISDFEETIKNAFDLFKGHEKELSAITSLVINGAILYGAELLFSLNTLEDLDINYRGTSKHGIPPRNMPQVSLSKPIGECRNLKKLSFSTPYSGLPEWIFSLTSLTDLCLGDYWFENKSIISLPESLGNLSNLKLLSLRLMEITSLPDSITNLKHLKYLEISSRRIMSLPESIGNLTTLEELHIDIPIKVLPESIRNLTNLLELTINYTNIIYLPENIGSLTNLVNLGLISNKSMEKLPDAIGNLLSLRRMSVCWSAIKELPKSMANLKSLRELAIRYTGIQEIPSFLGSLSDLTISMSGLDAEIPPELLQNKDINIYPNPKHKIKILPHHEMNFDEFIHAYYEFIRDAYYYSCMARREGLLALEEYLNNSNDFFNIGLRLVVDGTDPELVRKMLTCKLEREHDFLKNKLRQVQMEALLSIQIGEIPEELILRLNQRVDIDGNKVTPLCNDYLKGNLNALDDLEDLHHELPPEREEVAFIERAVSISEKARREGIPALEDERSSEGYAEGDIFEYGLSLIIDDLSPRYIEAVLDAMIKRERCPWKKKMGQVKKAAVLSIQSYDNPRILEEHLMCYFDDDVRSFLKEACSREE